MRFKLLPLLANIYQTQGDAAAASVVRLAYSKIVEARKEKTKIQVVSAKYIINCKPGENFKDLSGPTLINLACYKGCLLYTSPSPRDKRQSRMPSSA